MPGFFFKTINMSKKKNLLILVKCRLGVCMTALLFDLPSAANLFYVAILVMCTAAVKKLIMGGYLNNEWLFFNSARHCFCPNSGFPFFFHGTFFKEGENTSFVEVGVANEVSLKFCILLYKNPCFLLNSVDI